MTRAHYDQYDYPSYWMDRDYEHQSEVAAIRSLLGRIPKLNKVLDIGSGYGRLTPYYAFRAKKLVLLDPSKKLLAEAKKRLETQKEQFGLKKKRVDYIVGRVEDIEKKLNNKDFDLALMVRVMHHISDPEKSIKAVSDVLSPGGYFVLEFANKIHAKALISNLMHGNFTFPIDIFPISRLSKKNTKNECIPFINYHPDVIKDMLKKNGFKILQVRSVSNVRSPFLKKHLPPEFLIWIEKYLQKPLAHIYFGPSIFILARKKVEY